MIPHHGMTSILMINRSTLLYSQIRSHAAHVVILARGLCYSSRHPPEVESCARCPALQATLTVMKMCDVYNQLALQRVTYLR